MRGDARIDSGYVLLRGIITHGITHVELRDEIYCQLIRQCTHCSNEEWAVRVWQLFALCSVVFLPSKTFRKVHPTTDHLALYINALRIISRHHITIHSEV